MLQSLLQVTLRFICSLGSGSERPDFLIWVMSRGGGD